MKVARVGNNIRISGIRYQGQFSILGVVRTEVLEMKGDDDWYCFASWVVGQKSAGRSVGHGWVSDDSFDGVFGMTK